MLSRKSTTLFSLLCLLALLLCGEWQARADSIVIESGFISGEPTAGDEYFRGTFHGGGFTFSGTSENIISPGPFGQRGGTITGSSNTSFGGLLNFYATRGSETYRIYPSSLLRFVTVPVVIPDVATPIGQEIVLQVPFTMTGTLILSSGSFLLPPDFSIDVSGAGIATITLRAITSTGYMITRLRYDFAPAPVPEPASLLLLGGGLSALGGYVARRRKAKEND